jgi:hypothetical protein
VQRELTTIDRRDHRNTTHNTTANVQAYVKKATPVVGGAKTIKVLKM